MLFVLQDSYPISLFLWHYLGNQKLLIHLNLVFLVIARFNFVVAILAKSATRLAPVIAEVIFARTIGKDNA